MNVRIGCVRSLESKTFLSYKIKSLTFQKQMNVRIGCVRSLESKTFLSYNKTNLTFQKRMNVRIGFVRNLESNTFLCQTALSWFAKLNGHIATLRTDGLPWQCCGRTNCRENVVVGQTDVRVLWLDKQRPFFTWIEYTRDKKDPTWQKHPAQWS